MDKSILKDDRFAIHTTGITVESMSPVRCTLVIEDKHKNARDAVMGGAIIHWPTTLLAFLPIRRGLTP